MADVQEFQKHDLSYYRRSVRQDFCPNLRVSPSFFSFLPWRPDGTLIASDDSWETVGTRVNEGAAPLYHGGRTFLSYSAAGKPTFPSTTLLLA
jgi:hypothetical protein